LNIAFDIIATNHIKNHIHTLAAGGLVDNLDKIFFAIVDCAFRPQLLTGSTLFRAAGCGEYTHTEVAGNLDRRGTDSG